MILYVLKGKACNPFHLRKLLLLFRKYNIYTMKIYYLKLVNKKKIFQELDAKNEFDFTPSKDKYSCVFLITNFQYSNKCAREIKEKYRAKFGHEVIHASDNDWLGSNEIEEILSPNNKVLFWSSQTKRNEMLKTKGYFI